VAIPTSPSRSSGTERAGDRIREQIDTTTPAGRLQFHLFGAFAEFEREVIRERSHAGLTAARARGRTGGRPIALTGEQLAVARSLRSNGQSMVRIARVLGVHRATLYRHLGAESDQQRRQGVS
jgi:DNA invertase Pin-like site-specific DNA recombinase